MTIAAIYRDLFLLQSRAKMNLRMGKLELAHTQAATALQLFETYPTDDDDWENLSVSLADLAQMMNMPEACDRFMRQALAGRASGAERGDREAFYAKFLFAQGRLDEAEVHALEAIRAPCGEVGFAVDMLQEIRAARAGR